MDTVSHLLIGGAIGQLALGRRAGNVAVAWGAAVSLVPDVDVPIGAMMGDAAALTFHRGITHSLLFVTLLAPLLGWLLSRLHRRRGAGWRQWSLMVWLVLLSHLVIDAFTSYGIQLFLPFSDHAVALASISVIDPLYTLPLLLTVSALVFFHEHSRWRSGLAWCGVILSSAYLAFTLAHKWWVTSVFETGLEQADIEYERLFVKPTVFNNVLWRGIAEVDDGYWVGFHSRLDDGPPEEFVHFERRGERLDPYRDAPVVQDLLQVSEGYYQMAEQDGDLLFRDLRYGQAFEWIGDDRPHVFTYRIIAPEGPDGPVDIETLSLEVEGDRDRATARALWERLKGRD